MRLDFGRPMAKGNFIVLKGSSRRGKTTIAYNTIKRFLLESEEHRAVYVGFTQNAGQKLFEQLPADCKDRAMALGIESSSLMPSSDADYILAPHAALRAATPHQKVLLVFDDVLLHKFKEKLVYDLASQPFSPFNIVNEISDHTGTFANGKTLTTLVIADTSSNQLQFQKDEDAVLVHLESLADQIIEFEDEQMKKRSGGSSLPILPTKPGQKMPH